MIGLSLLIQAEILINLSFSGERQPQSVFPFFSGFFHGQLIWLLNGFQGIH